MHKDREENKSYSWIEKEREKIYSSLNHELTLSIFVVCQFVLRCVCYMNVGSLNESIPFMEISCRMAFMFLLLHRKWGIMTFFYREFLLNTKVQFTVEKNEMIAILMDFFAYSTQAGRHLFSLRNSHSAFYTRQSHLMLIWSDGIHKLDFCIMDTID